METRYEVLRKAVAKLTAPLPLAKVTLFYMFDRLLQCNVSYINDSVTLCPYVEAPSILAVTCTPFHALWPSGSRLCTCQEAIDAISVAANVDTWGTCSFTCTSEPGGDTYQESNCEDHLVPHVVKCLSSSLSSFVQLLDVVKSSAFLEE